MRVCGEGEGVHEVRVCGEGVLEVTSMHLLVAIASYCTDIARLAQLLLALQIALVYTSDIGFNTPSTRTASGNSDSILAVLFMQSPGLPSSISKFSSGLRRIT